VGNTGLGFGELALAAAIIIAALGAFYALNLRKKRPTRSSEQITPSVPEKSE